METNQSRSSSGVPRREFIKKTATAAAAVATTSFLKTPVYGANTAPSANVTGANDKITVAVIGLGVGIGKNHLQGIHQKAGENNTQIAAVCDLFNKRRDWGKQEAGLKDSDSFTEHKKLLERKDIDAVVIATHDPWHAQISIDAMEAGKHVYCEKPMTRYLDEAFKVHDAVKKTGKIYQVGSQGCSAAGWHKCGEMIKAGKIGTLVWGQGYYCRNIAGGEWNYELEAETKPENIDWEHWLGPVKQRDPFSAEQFHRWRKYYRYCAGLLGDLVPHRLHPLMLASGNPEFPVRVCSIATKNVHSDKEKPAPEREVAEHMQLLAEFPSGYMVTITCSTVNAKSPGFAIYGHKATMNIGSSGERIELVPEKDYAEEIDPETISGLTAEDPRVHEKNWFDSIRANKQPNAGIDLAIRVQTVISLAEMSDRLKTTCLFDEKSRKISDGSGKDLTAITYGTLPLS
ncbi:MAG TPA: Gfo/Idh/MocA family oxidoreductase [Candidatus Dormibacteraeota bacterium]|nr:Gfo/Idh/MocA family oxidoreductase [Candidatus Dormibacteraeota bacterium]